MTSRHLSTHSWRKLLGMAALLALGACDASGGLQTETLSGLFGGPSTPTEAAAPATPAATPAGATPVSTAPAATADAGIAAARQCGAVLGIASRCNMIRDDRDFAVLHYAVASGLESRYPATDHASLEQTLDLATLDRLASVDHCDIPASRRTELADHFQTAIAGCTQR